MTNMLVVVHVITGLGDGGAEAALSRLCLSDKEDKHIVVSLMGFGKYGPILQKAGVKVLPLHMRPGRLTISGLRQLWMIVREERPDVPCRFDWRRYRTSRWNPRCGLEHSPR